MEFVRKEDSSVNEIKHLCKSTNKDVNLKKREAQLNEPKEVVQSQNLICKLIVKSKLDGIPCTTIKILLQ